MSMSVSFKKATNKTNIKHNNREFTDKQKEQNSHIDFSKSDENKILVQKDLRELYEREFSEPLKNYNDKQKRNDRKIDDYYQHIKDSKKTSLQQEMIIQVGDKDDFNSPEDFEQANEILEEWFSEFEERNPNLKVYNAVIHNDEASPHLHLNFVPVASDYKRGLEKQVSFDRAIKQQDKTLNKQRPFNDWREKEVNLIADKLKERGIERKLVGTNDYKDVNEYKERKDLQREIKILKKDLSQKKNELERTKSEVLALTDDTSKKADISKLGAKYETKTVKVPSGETIGIGKLRHEFMKKEEQKTGNVVIPKQKLDEFLQDHDDLYKANQRLKRYVETDLPKANKKLFNAYDDLRHRFNVNVDDYNDLLEQKRSLEEENKTLKDTVKSLKKEIGSIYHNVKDALKSSISNSKAVSNFMRVIAKEVSEDVKKPEFGRIESQAQRKERNLNRGMSR